MEQKHILSFHLIKPSLSTSSNKRLPYASIPWINDVINPRERTSSNQKPPHEHHMDPMAHQSDLATSNIHVHKEQTSGPAK
jgi:hypothetical protein